MRLEKPDLAMIKVEILLQKNFSSFETEELYVPPKLEMNKVLAIAISKLKKLSIDVNLQKTVSILFGSIGNLSKVNKRRQLFAIDLRQIADLTKKN